MSLEIAADRAGGREWIGLAVLTLQCLLVAMDLRVLYLAIPHLTADLAPSAVDDAVELDQKRVPHGLDQPAMVVRYSRLEKRREARPGSGRAPLPRLPG
jgi:hypothetical protein